MNANGIKTLTTAAALAMGILTAPSANAATDIFLKIGDIEGEAQDAKHKGEIDVLAWSWGMSQDNQSSSSRGNIGVCIGDLSLVKSIDTASAALIMGTTINEQYPEAILTVRQAGQEQVPLEYLVIRMTDVSLGGYSTGGASGEDRLTENLTLNFTEAEWIYTETADDGSAGEIVTAFVTGKKGGCK